MHFEKLKILNAQPILDGQAKVLTFFIPDHLQNDYQFHAGQSLMLRFIQGGKDVMRNYSICSNPNDVSQLQICVKRVKGGLISNYINDQINTGDVLEVSPPMGSFKLETKATNRKSYYLFAAGSGITPNFAMLQSVLESEPNSFVYMLYGNKDQNNIIFLEELRKLQESYQDRFLLQINLSSPTFWGSMEGYEKGRIEPHIIRKFIRDNAPYAQNAEYYICGPNDMNISVKGALHEIDVPLDRIHYESFGGASDAIDPWAQSSSDYKDANLIYKGADGNYELQVSANQDLLSAMLKQNIEAPNSCRSGICGACKAKLIKGKVHMKQNAALDENELSQNLILTCQAHALTDEITLKSV